MNWNKLSLKCKLTGGFSTVLFLLLIISVVAFYALRHAATGFDEYREMVMGTNLGGQIQANMLSARMSASNFIDTGSDNHLEDFNTRWKKLLKLQAQAIKNIQEPEWAVIVKEVEKDLNLYQKGFEQIIQRGNQRNKLVYEVLNIEGPFMEKALTDIMVSANNDGDQTASFFTGLAMKHLLLARLYMAKFLDANDQSDVDRVHEEFRKMIKYLDVLDNELENPKRRELLSKVSATQKKYNTVFDELVTTIVERNKIVADILVKAGSEISVEIENVKLDIEKHQDELGVRLDASEQKAITTIVIICLMAVIIGVFIVVFIIRSVMGQLGSDPADIAEIADSIAKGNLAVKFDENEKKITGVYASMKHMTQNLSSMFRDITQGAHTLDSSSSELSTVSEQMASNAEQTSNRTSNVAAASEEMSTNMNSVAAATEQATANIQTIVSAVEEMSATINEIASNTAKGSKTTSKAVKTAGLVSGKVDELGKAASEINKVTETIANISEQTNLLALNATIEAARAGEAGKGFAVVAGEIKDLAMQTAEATNEINTKITGIQTTTKESVEAIGSIVSIINEINEIVTTVATAIEEQSVTTQEISTNVSQAAAGVQEVNESVNQTSAVVGEVNMDISQVSQAAEEIKTGGHMVNSRASEMSGVAKSLNEMIGRFTI